MASVNRLSSPSAFRSVFSTGRSYAQGAVVLYVAKRTTGSGPARAGLGGSRKVGGAGGRHGDTRLLREAMRLEGRNLPEGLDLVLVARPSVAGASYGDIAGDIRDVVKGAGRGGPARRGRRWSDVPSTTPRPSRPAAVLMGLIGAYQRWISPFLGNRCRFHPSCSAYAQTAVANHAALKGSWLAVRRLVKCQPFHPGGFDY